MFEEICCLDDFNCDARLSFPRWHTMVGTSWWISPFITARWTPSRGSWYCRYMHFFYLFAIKPTIIRRVLRLKWYQQSLEFLWRWCLILISYSRVSNIRDSPIINHSVFATLPNLIQHSPYINFGEFWQSPLLFQSSRLLIHVHSRQR